VFYIQNGDKQDETKTIIISPNIAAKILSKHDVAPEER